MKEGMSPGRKREFLVFASLSGIVFLCLAGFLAFFSQREGARRRLDIEYQAFQISSAAIDDWIDGTDVAADLPFGITAFGIYDENGAVVKKSAKAPETVMTDAPGSESVTISGGRLRLVRQLGKPGMGRMLGGNRPADPAKAPPGQMPGMQKPNGQRMGNPFLGGLRRDGLFLYIELPSVDFERQEALVSLAMGIIFAAVCGLYALIVLLYRRNLVFAEREEKSRELVQLGEAARTIAHEIKNPLSVIRLQCATLEKLIPAERSRNLDIIREETERLAALTDKIGDFLRSDQGNPEVLDLGAWALEFAERNALPLSREDRLPLSIRIDPSRLESMVGNLVKNAREASPDSEGVCLSVIASSGAARIEVCDRGPGIAPDVAERMFKPFYTTKSRGSGIGLSLAMKFAQEAGGSLEYRKRDGGGSVFCISLPAAV